MADYSYITTNRTSLFNFTYLDYSPSGFGNYTLENEDGTQDCSKFFKLAFYGFVIGLLCIFGFLGNTLSIVVLQKDRNNKVAGFLLQALAIADNSVLLVSFIVFAWLYSFLPLIKPDVKQSMTALAYIAKYVHPVAYMSQTATIWLTVLLSFNRFIAICQPFRAHKLCTRKKVQIQVACVFIFAFIFNFPRFFQYEIINVPYDQNSPEDLAPYPKETVIGEKTTFGVVYSNALYTILVLLLPLLLLLFLNISLIIEMRKMQKRMVSMGPSITKEENITVVMVIIVVVFLVCHTPDRIQMILNYVHPVFVVCDTPMYYFHSICNMLIVLNSSSNFLIYYFFRKRFRDILFKKLCCFSFLKKKDRIGANSEYLDNHNMTLLTKIHHDVANGNGNGVIKPGEKLLLTSDKA